MTDAILAICIVAVFVGGFFIMNRLDAFLNRKFKTDDSETRFRLLSSDWDEEKISSEISDFRRRHRDVKILLYDGSDKALCKQIEKRITKR